MTRYIVALACMAPLAGLTAPFADPTRPPNAAAVDGGADAGGIVPASRLESVLIAPDRRIAIIGGQQYRAGDRVGEGTIVRISEGEVAIRTGEAVEVLKLFPAAEKRPRRTKGAK